MKSHRAPAIRLHPHELAWQATGQLPGQLIAGTTTDTGLTVACQLDANANEKGIKVSDDEMASPNVKPASFHGEWNYTIAPRRPRE